MDFIKVEEALELINERVLGWLETAIKNIPNLVVAFAITLVFIFAARIISNGFNKLMHRSLDSRQIAELLTSILRVLIIAVGMFIALDFVGLKGTVTSLLAGAGIIGLALGFAFQDMTENLIAGIAMGIRKPFRIGDIIEADDVFGEVKKINLRNTLVESFYGQQIIVPNKMLFQNKLTNYSTYGVRRLEIPVGISYGDDPTKAKEAIIEAINKLDFVIRQDETDVYAEGFGDSSVNLLVWFWIEYPGEAGFMVARHEAVVTIKKALEDADILIPFPIRTLDFDAKGGRSLDSIAKRHFSVQQQDRQHD